MTLLLASFLAGALSVLAPCVVAFVPAMFSRGTGERRPWVAVAALGVSVIVFSVLLKSTTLLIDVPPRFWSTVSGVIVALFGVVMIWPRLWDALAFRLGLGSRAQERLARASVRRGIGGDILLGASMGPVFSACSPTYALIVAAILPAEPLRGLGYLVAYVAGLTLLLAAVMVGGRALLARLRWAIDPEGTFHKVLGLVLVLIGVAIATGLDKTLLTLLVERGLFDWQIGLEGRLSTDR
ncbi:cytochrome c biogenesis CcdA family protein [Nocardioides luteus]|uniref:cytochrome c biogenesis CcdA family protein n=1 Tax=Nocardioides luteus TaxID=1844 RepID=UPI0018C9E97C|nr:sulfite exporter TauE/SafE family protein [Nocardioides luteus]MBG6097746.1 cytochrome c biogenesis protein CcdA [Nocardioides luteus]